MVNALSELQKRAVAYSGQADIGDVPPLYAAQRAAQQAATEQALSGAGGAPSGGGGVAPLASAAGGGAVGGSADFGLPGTTGDPGLDEALAQSYRGMITSGQGDQRGPPGRDAQNPEVESFLSDYFGFLENPAAIGMSAPFVGSFASLLGPYFGATDIPEAAPLTPTGLLAQLLGDSGVAQGTAERVGTGIAAPDEATAAALSEQYSRELGLNPNLGSGLGAVYSPTNVLGGLVGGGGGSDRGGGRGIGDVGRGTCFAAGTMVLMGGMTERPIEQIKLGDEVMGFSEAGPPEVAMVIGVQAHKNVNIVRVNGDTLATANHPFFTETHPNGFEFVAAEELLIGQNLMGVDGEKIRIDTLEKTSEVRDVFNITVEGLHTYFANGYRVHNKDVA